MADPISDAVYSALQQMQAHPELRMALMGVAGNTVPGQRLSGAAPQPGGGPRAFQVPGQAERFIGTEQPGETIGTHNGGMPIRDRIGAAFDASTMQPPPAPELSRALGQPDLQTTLASLASGAGDATATGSPEDRGLLGQFVPAGVSNFISDAGTGLAVADPRHPASMAFGEAFAGAQGSNRARLDRKRAEQKDLKAEARQAKLDAQAEAETQYRHGRDRITDERWRLEYAREEEANDLATDTAHLNNAFAAIKLRTASSEYLAQQMRAAGIVTTDDQIEIGLKAADLATKAKIAADARGEEFDFDTELRTIGDALIAERRRLITPSDTTVAPKTDRGAGVTGTTEGEDGDLVAGPEEVEPAKPLEKSLIGTSKEHALTIPEGADPSVYVPAAAKKLGLKTIIFKNESGGFNVWP